MARIHQGIDRTTDLIGPMMPFRECGYKPEKDLIRIERTVNGVSCVFFWHSDPAYIPSSYSVKFYPVGNSPSNLHLSAIHQDSKGNWQPHPNPLALLEESWADDV